jgi:hypothetical protein
MPTPAPTPAPTPTPLPKDSGSIGPEGGVLWVSGPGHLTALHVAPGSLSSSVTLTVTADEARPTGALATVHHYFTVSGPVLTEPVAVVLGFKDAAPIVEGTLGLYRLDGGSWVTDSITVTEVSPGHLLARITRPGSYAILGETHRIYLPMTSRR